MINISLLELKVNNGRQVFGSMLGNGSIVAIIVLGVLALGALTTVCILKGRHQGKKNREEQEADESNKTEESE